MMIDRKIPLRAVLSSLALLLPRGASCLDTNNCSSWIVGWRPLFFLIYLCISCVWIYLLNVLDLVSSFLLHCCVKIAESVKKSCFCVSHAGGLWGPG